MNAPVIKPALLVKEGGQLPIAGEALAELMSAVLGKGRAFRFRARGLSMSPFVRDGDIVTVAPTVSAPPRTGEIAAFVHAETGRLRIHRIIGIKEGRCLLKGDNALEPDGEVPVERILGLVVRVERDGRPARPGRGLAGAAIARASRAGLFIRALRRIGRAFPWYRRKA